MLSLVAIFKVLYWLNPVIRYNSMEYKIPSYIDSKNFNQRLKESFVLLDKDNNFLISAIDLDDVLSAMGLDYSKLELHKIINDVKKDNRGILDFADIVKSLLVVNQFSPNKEETREVFEIFDRNMDGSITLDEFRQLIFKLNNRLAFDYILINFIEDFDSNKDEKISFEEFSRKYATILRK